MRLYPHGVRAQVTLAVALLVMLVVALAGVVIGLRSADQDLRQVDSQLRSRVAKVEQDAGKIAPGSDLTDDTHSDGNLGDLLAGSQTLTRILGPDNSLITQKGEIPTTSEPIAVTPGFSNVSIGGQSWRSYVSTVPDGGHVQVLASLEPVEQRRHANTQLIAAVTLAATLAAALLAWIVSGLLLQPLKRLREAAQAVRQLDDGSRLPELHRPLEVAELSNTLQDMLDRLDISAQATRRFTADAGHELRTPLASLGINLDILRREGNLSPATRAQVIESMATEHERIVNLLEGLQTLARGDAGVLTSRSTVDVSEVVDLAVARARRRHTSSQFELSIDRTEDWTATGWAEGLRLAVENLLDNAALHGRPTTPVQVTLQRHSPDTMLVNVSDDGPGIAEHDHDRLKQRFARSENPNSTGSGLGLALVEQQAHLHGGELLLDRSARGGLSATISITLLTSDKAGRRGELRNFPN